MKILFGKQDVKSLAEAYDISSLAGLIGVPHKELVYCVYLSSIQSQYQQFEIKKKVGGTRLISAPTGGLKTIQRQLAAELQNLRTFNSCVKGFVSGRDIHENAALHTGRRLVLNLDIEDFFGSINFGRVYGMLMSPPYSLKQPVAACIAKACTLDNKLPQGAPTSPILSNLICGKLDAEMLSLAKKFRFRYSRYADDLTISTNKPGLEPIAVHEFVPEDNSGGSEFAYRPGEILKQVIENNGFKINAKKFRVANKHNRQEVTGIVVNEFPNVKRRYVRQIRAMLHAWEKFGYNAARERHNEEFNIDWKSKEFSEVLKGKLAFLRHVKGAQDSSYVKLANKFNALNPGNKIETALTPKERAKAATWVIESKDQLIGKQGTTFLLEGVGFVTCAHCVVDEMVLYHPSDFQKKYPASIKFKDDHKDVAILNVPDDVLLDLEPIPRGVELPVNQTFDDYEITLMGYPKQGNWHYPIRVEKGLVLRTLVRQTVTLIDVTTTIIEGNSGGPILNAEFQAIGVAKKGINKDTKKDDAEFLSISISELV